MPEIRVDPVTGHSVLFAPERMARPNAFTAPSAKDHSAESPSGPRHDCPFCPGQESQTPTEVARFAHPGDNAKRDLPVEAKWQVRVVPNRYPAVTNDPFATHAPEQGHTKSGPEDPAMRLDTELYATPLPAHGRHEVIIESPRHADRITLQSLPAVGLILDAYAHRLQHLADSPDIRYGIVFKNQGLGAGASLEHPHSQLVGLDHIPRDIRQQIERADSFRQRTGDCLLCRLVEREIEGPRRIDANEHFLAFCPYASRLPYEFWLVPRSHQAHFYLSTSVERDSLGRLLRNTLRNLEIHAQEVPYNYLIHSAPFDIAAGQHYHWRMEVLPRLARVAGFEWGSGCFMNPMLPEEAARRLRASQGERH